MIPGPARTGSAQHAALPDEFDEALVLLAGLHVGKDERFVAGHAPKSFAQSGNPRPDALKP